MCAELIVIASQTYFSGVALNYNTHPSPEKLKMLTTFFLFYYLLMLKVLYKY
jgi:hypothetical protein